MRDFTWRLQMHAGFHFRPRTESRCPFQVKNFLVWKCKVIRNPVVSILSQNYVFSKFRFLLKIQSKFRYSDVQLWVPVSDLKRVLFHQFISIPPVTTRSVFWLVHRWLLLYPRGALVLNWKRGASYLIFCHFSQKHLKLFIHCSIAVCFFKLLPF